VLEVVDHGVGLRADLANRYSTLVRERYHLRVT
jgi:hypothetical protein